MVITWIHTHWTIAIEKTKQNKCKRAHNEYKFSLATDTTKKNTNRNGFLTELIFNHTIEILEFFLQEEACK